MKICDPVLWGGRKAPNLFLSVGSIHCVVKIPSVPFSCVLCPVLLNFRYTKDLRLEMSEFFAYFKDHRDKSEKILFFA